MTFNFKRMLTSIKHHNATPVFIVVITLSALLLIGGGWIVAFIDESDEDLLHDILVPADDAQADGLPNGLSRAIDPSTGCEYLVYKTAYSTSITPRLDVTGAPMGCDPVLEVDPTRSG